MRTVGAKDIAEKTGNTMRTIQHWISEGVLIPLPGTESPGRGSTRQFCDEGPHREMVWALIATALAGDHYGGSSIANIKRLIGVFRQEYTPQSENSPIAAALKGDLVLIVYGGDPTHAGDETRWSLTEYNFKDPSRQPDAIAKNIVGHGERRGYGLLAVPIVEFMLRPRPSQSAHVLNITEILRPLRSGE